MAKTSTPTALYLEAVDWLAEQGYLLDMDPFAGSEYFFHRIFKKTNPKSEKGLEYPEAMQWWRPLYREEIVELEAQFYEEDSGKENFEYVDILSPVFNVDVSSKSKNRLISIVKRQLKLEPQYEQTKGITVFDKGMLKEKGAKLERFPKAFIPAEDWFSESLDILQPEDVLTILPKAEQEIYILAIGRAVVGASGITHVATNRYIEHNWRTACVLTGVPGIGKSTLTKYLGDALSTVGYNISSFSTLGKQFGLADIICADLAYADDLNQKTFKEFIDSAIIKQAITGGTIRTEKKFLDEVESKPSALFICNINDFDINATYGADDGVLDRLKILNCNTPTQFDKNCRNQMSDLCKKSPDLHPIPHIKWLCNKLNCSQNTLMLKFAQLCAYRFIEHMEKNNLNTAINKISCQLNVQLHKNYDKVLAMIFQLSYILRRKDNFEDELPDLKPLLLGSAIRATLLVVVDKRTHIIREMIKADWKEKNQPSFHPWTGLKLLDVIGLDNAVRDYDSVAATYADKDMAQCVKTIFSAIRLRHGYNVPANLSQVTRSWEGSKQQFNSLLQLASKIRKNLPPEVLELLTSGENAQSEHIREEDFNRQKFADSIREETSSNIINMKDYDKNMSPSL